MAVKNPLYGRPLRFSCPSDMGLVSRMRRLILSTLPGDVSDHTRSDIELAVGELLANAIGHGDGTGITVNSGIRGRRFSVSVVNHGEPFDPLMQMPGCDSLRGRGLALMCLVMDEVYVGIEESTIAVTISKSL